MKKLLFPKFKDAVLSIAGIAVEVIAQAQEASYMKNYDGSITCYVPSQNEEECADFQDSV